MPMSAGIESPLAKVFHLTEKLNLEFRGDMYNAFNHAQWSSIDTNFSTAGDSQFGRITGAREPRIAQLSLKVSF